MLSANGLTPGQGQARILNNLLYEDGLSQKELSFRCHMDTTTMSRNIDKLEKIGLLLRKQDPTSRRAVKIFLTAQGFQKAHIIHDMFETFEGKLVEGIKEEEVDIFQKVLLKMCENLDAYLEKEDQN